MSRTPLWRAIGGPFAVSWVSVALSTGLALSSALWLIQNFPVSDMAVWVGQTCGLAALLVVLLVARLTWLRPSRLTRPRPWLALTTFAIASGARVAVVGVVAAATGEWGQWPPEQTLIFGLMGQVVLLVIVSVAVNTVRAGSASIARIEAARQTVERARALSEEDVAATERAFVEGVLDSVQGTITHLQQNSDQDAVVDGVRRAALEIVRPASHSLHAGEVAQRAAQALEPRVRLREVLADLRPTASIAGPLAYELLNFGTILGALGSAAAVVNFIVGSAMLITANLLIATVWRAAAPRHGRAVVLFLAYLMGNIVALLIVAISIGQVVGSAESLWLGFGIYPVFMLLLSIVSSVARQRSRLESDLDKALETEAHALAQVSTLAAEQRLRLSRLMHGGLQADLIAAAAVLDAQRNLGESESPSAQTLGRLTLELRDRYASLDTPTGDQRLEDLVETWRLATDVDLSLEAGAARALDADSRLRSQVVSIVSEALTNAVRHGSGSTIYVKVTEGSAVLSINVAHHGELGSTDRGLGLTEIDLVADSWELRQDGNEVVLHAEVVREK